MSKANADAICQPQAQAIDIPAAVPDEQLRELRVFSCIHHALNAGHPAVFTSATADFASSLGWSEGQDFVRETDTQSQDDLARRLGQTVQDNEPKA